MVKLENTLETDIKTAKSLEDMIKGRTTTQDEVKEKRINEGSSYFNKKRRFSKTSPNDKKPRDNNELNWCERCRKKHYGQCKEDVICYHDGVTGHCANECKRIKRLCFQSKEEGNV